VFELKLHGTLFVNSATSSGGSSDQSTIAMFEGCAKPQNQHSPRCGQQPGSLQLKVAYPKGALFTKAKHRNLFDKTGQGGTLTLYARGSTTATQTFTWSLRGLYITSIQFAPSKNGVVTETITLSYRGFRNPQRP
jgi:hypothetical protein